MPVRYFKSKQFWIILSAVIACAVLAAEPGAPGGAATPGDEKEEKPKDPPFEFSAWCAFRDLSYIAPPQMPRKKGDPVSDESRPGSANWSGFGRRGQWATLVVDIKNTTEKDQYKGYATIMLNPLKPNDQGVIPYTTTYRKDFELGPQTEKQLRFSVLMPEHAWTDAVLVQIVANGVTYPRYVQIHDLEGEDFIVVVSEGSGSFRYLIPKKPINGAQLTLTDDESKERSRKVAVIEPQEMPTRWHDLALANLIIIDGPPREQLSEAQWDALKSYVKSGGHILITSGKDPSRLRGAIEDIAGIAVREMREVESLDEIVPPLISPRKDWKLPLVDVTASPKGNPFVDHNTKTNYVERSVRFYGSGTVTFLPFSLSDTMLDTWEGRTDVPLSILRTGHTRTLFSLEDAEDLSSPNPNQRNSRPRNTYFQTPPQEENVNKPDTMAGFRYKLDESFSTDTVVTMQKPPTVLSFLLLYLLCAVPGNYFIFGWFKRREIAWLAVPFWAASFSGIAYGVGYMGQTGQLTVNEVSVLEAGPGQDIGIARTFFGMYAPYGDDYRIEFPSEQQAAPGHLINLTNSENRNIDMPELRLVDTDAGIGIEKLRVQQRSTRRLEIMHRARLGQGGVDVHFAAAKESGGYDLEIQNNTGYDLFHPVLIYNNQAVSLTDENSEILSSGTKQKFEAVQAISLPTGATQTFDAVSATATFTTPSAHNFSAGQIVAVTSAIVATNNGTWIVATVPTTTTLTAVRTHGVKAWEAPGTAFFGKNITFRTARGEHATKRTQALMGYMQSHAGSFTNGVVCAWIEGGFLPVKIAASGAKTAENPGQFEGLTLLLVPLPLPAAKSRIGQVDPGPLPVRYSLNYDMNSGQGEWLPYSNENLTLKPVVESATATSGAKALREHFAETYLELHLPDNYAALNLDGMQLQLQYKIGAAQSNRNKQTQYSADLEAAVKKLQNNGTPAWEDLPDAGSIFNFRSDRPRSMPIVNFSMVDYRLVSADSKTILLRVRLKNIQVNNVLWNGSANQPLVLQNVKLTLGLQH